MDILKKVVLFMFIASCHFLLQAVTMVLSLAGKLIYYKDSFWSLGGVFTFITSVLYRVLAFPFIWIFQKWSIEISGLADAPFYLNSFVWASLLTLLILKIRENRKSKYHFVRGVSR